jgi:hypothetical protein
MGGCSREGLGALCGTRCARVSEKLRSCLVMWRWIDSAVVRDEGCASLNSGTADLNTDMRRVMQMQRVVEMWV